MENFRAIVFFVRVMQHNRKLYFCEVDNMSIKKMTLEEFLKAVDDYEKEKNSKDVTRFQHLMGKIAQTCGALKDCYFDCGASVIFASSKGKDEKIHLTTYCNSNYALTVAVGLIQMILSREDIPAEALMEEIKTRIFDEEE